MKILLLEHPECISAEKLQQDLTLLPVWRKKQVQQHKFLIDKVLCAKAYLSLKEALLEEYGISANPTFVYQAHGKPMLKEFPHLHFNLSHCKKGVLCVLSNQPVGCDIEEVDPQVDPDLYAYCLSPKEFAQVMAAPNPSLAFTLLWTQKEAYLKLTGEGITQREELRNLLERDSSPEKYPVFQSIVKEEGSFVYTIATF